MFLRHENQMFSDIQPHLHLMCPSAQPCRCIPWMAPRTTGQWRDWRLSSSPDKNINTYCCNEQSNNGAQQRTRKGHKRPVQLN